MPEIKTCSKEDITEAFYRMSLIGAKSVAMTCSQYEYIVGELKPLMTYRDESYDNTIYPAQIYGVEIKLI